MDVDELNAKIQESMGTVDEETTIAFVSKAIDHGIPPFEIVDALSAGLREVGSKFEAREYFVVDLLMAAEIMKRAMDMLQPLMAEKTERRSVGTVVFGTVKGDIHDIGKNIVISLLRASGFEVHDLGVDTPTENFVQKTDEVKADFVAMSALFTPSLGEIKNVIGSLEEAGLRRSVKVAVGGAAVSRAFAEEAGADIYAKDAVQAVEMFKKSVED
ncbi:MAG: B12-binding domain-containing protein [Candidatus Geothermarchaeales archaeon]